MKSKKDKSGVHKFGFFFVDLSSLSHAVKNDVVKIGVS